MQQYGSKTLPIDTFSTGGERRSKDFFLKVVVLYIKLKRMEHRAKCKHIFCPYMYPRPLGWGQKVKTFFSENSHVAYQIKGKGAKSDMQSHILSLHTPLAPGWGQKVKTCCCFFLKEAMLHIKLKVMEHRAPCKHIVCPYTHPRPLGGIKRSKHFFSKVFMMHIKLKGMVYRASCKHIFCPYTHTQPLWLDQKVKTNFLNVVMLHIKTKW